MISEILFSVGVLPDNLIPIYTYRVDKTGIKVLEYLDQINIAAVFLNKRLRRVYRKEKKPDPL